MTQIELLSCPFCGEAADIHYGNSSAGDVWCSNGDCPLHEMLACTVDEWNTRSDTREQAAASPSAGGEGLLIELLRRAYRFVQSDNEFTERDWTEYENTKDEIRAVLSGQSPLRDALQTMIASAEAYIERDEVIGYRIKTGALHRVIGMLGLTVPCNLPVATLHANYGGFTQKSLDDARDYPLSSQAAASPSAVGEGQPQPFAFYDKNENRFWEAADNSRDYLSQFPEIVELYTREQMDALSSQAPPSAVGEAIGLRIREFRSACITYGASNTPIFREGVEAAQTALYEALSSQTPKPASAGGEQ